MTAPLTRRDALRSIGRGAALATGAVAVGTGVVVAAPLVPADGFIQYRVENDLMAPTISDGDLVLFAPEREPIRSRRIYALPRSEARKIITVGELQIGLTHDGQEPGCAATLAVARLRISLALLVAGE